MFRNQVIYISNYRNNLRLRKIENFKGIVLKMGWRTRIRKSHHFLLCVGHLSYSFQMIRSSHPFFSHAQQCRNTKIFVSFTTPVPSPEVSNFSDLK